MPKYNTWLSIVILQNKAFYNSVLVERLIALMNQSCQLNSCIRPVTLEMGCLLLKQLVFSNIQAKCFLEDRHLACVEVSSTIDILKLLDGKKACMDAGDQGDETLLLVQRFISQSCNWLICKYIIPWCTLEIACLFCKQLVFSNIKAKCFLVDRLLDFFFLELCNYLN